MRLVDADAIFARALELLQTGELENWEFDNIVDFLGGATEYGGAWINVEDRLPSKDGDYIVTVCDEWCPAGEGIWYDRVVVVAEYSCGSWTWYEEGAAWILDGIATHWMPMPAPPGGEEHG